MRVSLGYAARSGAAISSLLQPDDAGEKKLSDRDAMRENVLSIKKIVEERKARRMKEDAHRRQVPFKMKRFTQVSSRFMRSRDEDEKGRSGTDAKAGGEEKKGLRRIINNDLPSRDSMFFSITRRERARLQKILDEKERFKAAPPGYRYMEGDEQTDVLNNLRKRKEILEKEYHGLPLRIELRRQRERQKSIETSMEEVDAAIRKFSESDILIKLDE
ncbi:hypothetical protein FOZ63_004758 [Perkinsus olseni]|uniref:Enkurin domain-containing protein n=1 Tax=Perkinsus olseni TaxID=32597 RepID=A0A7J6T7C5_PEROL|nr:hypothetical protein FOZ63_004758 [Perkinsus olseni]KAF4740891.1 hypothetical protein FOZ62_027127 [Perkinsus olseni]